jgi:uncharacterized RDD family membrane protein YckC
VVVAADVPRTPSRRGLVTPEAVLLELDTAGVGTRAAAALIDLLLQFAALWLVFVLLLLVAKASETASLVVGFIALFGAFVGYPWISEWLWHGRTVGKLAMGLRVVTVEGAPVRFSHAAIRAMLGLVDFFLPPGGALAMLMVLGTQRNQRLGDVVAGTMVLAERRTNETTTKAVWFTVPPTWDEYLTRLDTSRVRPEQYRLLRAYVLRSPALAHGARATLAGQLCAGLGQDAGLPIPPGVDPMSWVLVVAAAYQRRQHDLTNAGPSAGVAR